ncbi:MAG: F-type H+-transporting ATPase subunit epsilon [Polaribacter sp.]|jgi:F-type H+-transporting ATPase subunit epsilon
MNLIVLTPGKKVFEGDITSVKVPGIGGQFEILNNHAPIVSGLGEGDVRIIETGGNVQRFKITQGFVEVLRNEVALLVQSVVEE